jgi:hypothetical protein
MRSLSLEFYMPSGLDTLGHLQQLPRRVQILHLAPAERHPASAPVGPPLWAVACIHASRRSKKMLWTICIVLLVLWALGMVTSYTAGGLLHLLLVFALVVLVIRLIQGRRFAT